MPKPTIVIYERHEDATSKAFLFKLLPALAGLGYTEFLLEESPKRSLFDIKDVYTKHIADVDARDKIFSEKPHLKQLVAEMQGITELELDQDTHAAARAELNLPLINYLIENETTWHYQGIELPDILGRANEIERLSGAEADAIDRKREQHFAACINKTIERNPKAGCVVLLGLAHFPIENHLPDNTIYVFPHSPEQIATLPREAQVWLNSFIDSARRQDGNVGSQTLLYTDKTPDVLANIISMIQLSTHPFLVRHWLNAESDSIDSLSSSAFFNTRKVDAGRDAQSNARQDNILTTSL